MFRSLTIILSLLTWEERKRLLKLTPLMVISSVFDVAIVMVAANYFQVLADPEKLQQSALASWASESLGLQDSQIVVAGGALVLSTVVLGNIYSVGVLHVVNLFSFSQIASVSERLLETYLTQPYSYFLSKSSSELVHRLMVEVSSVVSALIVQLSQVFARSLGALLMAGWLFLQDPVLGLLLAGVLGSFYVSVYSLLRGRLLLIGKTRSVNNKLRQQLATESLVGIKELKVLGLESQAVARFHVPSMAFVRSYALNTTIAGATKYLLETVGVGGVLVVVLYFLYTGQPLSGVLAILGAYAIAAYRLLPIFQAGFTTLSRIRFESHAAELIFNDLSLGIYGNPKVLPVVHFKESVRLNVGAFSYTGNDEKVLDKIDVTLKKRSWTALVGTTGSGKTTLVDVLLGLLSPDEGALEVDGKPIMSRDEVHAWQKLIGYAPQGMFMADDTVARNIAFGTEPDMDRVREVAQVASLDTFVEQDLSDGYDSMVGERGMRLSGGQVQRIGLARALYRKPELLVLDESTSALDNATEAKVMSALRSYLSDTTVVMVAHRLSTTRYCDRILILENGRVVDSGSYEELKANSQRFQVMLNASESV